MMFHTPDLHVFIIISVEQFVHCVPKQCLSYGRKYYIGRLYGTGYYYIIKIMVFVARYFEYGAMYAICVLPFIFVKTPAAPNNS